MSVESNFVLKCRNEKQVEAAGNYQECLTGSKQGYPISKKMDIDGLNVTVENCLCIDDFETYIPNWCKYIAESVPDEGFTAEGEFMEDMDGLSITHNIEYEDSTLTIETTKGYEVYSYDEEEDDEEIDDEEIDDEDMDEEDVTWDGETTTEVYKYNGKKLVKQ